MKMTRTKQQKQIDRDIDLVLDHCDAASAAWNAGKRGEEIAQMAIATPLFPQTAKAAVMVLGKKQFLEKGYDRTRADAEYGEGWIDEVEAERRELTGMAE